MSIDIHVYSSLTHFLPAFDFSNSRWCCYLSISRLKGRQIWLAYAAKARVWDYLSEFLCLLKIYLRASCVLTQRSGPKKFSGFVTDVWKIEQTFSRHFPENSNHNFSSNIFLFVFPSQNEPKLSSSQYFCFLKHNDFLLIIF